MGSMTPRCCRSPRRLVRNSRMMALMRRRSPSLLRDLWLHTRAVLADARRAWSEDHFVVGSRDQRQALGGVRIACTCTYICRLGGSAECERHITILGNRAVEMNKNEPRSQWQDENHECTRGIARLQTRY